MPKTGCLKGTRASTTETAPFLRLIWIHFETTTFSVPKRLSTLCLCRSRLQRRLASLRSTSLFITSLLSPFWGVKLSMILLVRGLRLYIFGHEEILMLLLRELGARWRGYSSPCSFPFTPASRVRGWGSGRTYLTAGGFGAITSFVKTGVPVPARVLKCIVV